MSCERDLILFGLKDWAEVLKMYEKDDLYLGVCVCVCVDLLYYITVS